MNLSVVSGAAQETQLESVQVLMQVFSEVSVNMFLVSFNICSVSFKQPEYFTFLTPCKHAKGQLTYPT